MERNLPFNPAARKRPYASPVLITYGKMAELTAAGTFGIPEGTQINNMQRHV